MSVWHERLKTAMDRNGWRPGELSVRSQVPVERIYKYLQGAVSQPRGDMVNRLADALGVPSLWLQHGIDQPILDARGARRLVAAETAGPPGRVLDLPILGHAEAGEDGTFLDNGAVNGFAGRPANLRGVDNAYALIVHNESMLPRYEPREMVEIDPNIPVRAGDYVVLQTTDGRAFIKLLRRRTEEAVFLEQYNPPKELRFAAADVAALHLIVGAHRVYR